MLVLSRRWNQDIVIGEGESKIVVTILEIRGNTVRIGITGHKSIRVVRGELREPPTGKAA